MQRALRERKIEKRRANTNVYTCAPGVGCTWCNNGREIAIREAADKAIDEILNSKKENHERKETSHA